LNPANLIVLPLILGIGVDDGVHVIHDFRMQSGRYETSSSTINAIMLTSLTSMIGFGSMMFAAHRGLASLGLVLVIGVGSCLFVSLVTLPAILTLVSRRRQSTGSEAPGSPNQPDGAGDSPRTDGEILAPPAA
jgi:predicted RND superfamily exporter protein